MTVRRPGLFTTVQDAGRTGWRRYGVPVSGAMDALALAVANRLVGNAPGTAVLECTLRGPILHFEEEVLVAVAGEVDAWADDEPLPTWRPVRIPAGTTVSLERLRSGCRVILAVAGGLEVAPVLGSASTYVRAGLGGVDGRALRAGDVLVVGRPSARAQRWLVALREQADLQGRKLGAPSWSAGWSLRSWAPREIRVLPGPEWSRFTEAAQRTFLTARYRVTPQADRMGIRLAGPILALSRPLSMRSEPVTPGTIQVPPDGQPIVLGADSQTTGGYPRLAVVIRADLPKLAQLRPGDTVAFVQVDEQTARLALAAQRQSLQLLDVALALAWKERERDGA